MGLASPLSIIVLVFIAQLLFLSVIDWALPYLPQTNSASNEGEMDYSLSPSLSSEAAAADQQPTIISIPLDREAILVCHGISWCSPAGDYPTCLHKSHTSYPCASVCSTQSCMPVFNAVISIAHEATENCDMVLYTMVLGYNVNEMALETKFSNGERQEE